MSSCGGYGVFSGGATRTDAWVWNVATGVFTQVDHNEDDIYCAGHAGLAEQRPFVAGGQRDNGGGTGGAGYGISDSNLFDFNVIGTGNEWISRAVMANRRWYRSTFRRLRNAFGWSIPSCTPASRIGGDSGYRAS
ncbi:MAG: hypothetical protein H0W86_05765 [Armatimonadetes bacterium]|nr:hypothetical protein [Armatimonadota bacterium]